MVMMVMMIMMIMMEHHHGDHHHNDHHDDHHGHLDDHHSEENTTTNQGQECLERWCSVTEGKDMDALLLYITYSCRYLFTSREVLIMNMLNFPVCRIL